VVEVGSGVEVAETVAAVPVARVIDPEKMKEITHYSQVQMITLRTMGVPVVHMAVITLAPVEEGQAKEGKMSGVQMEMAATESIWGIFSETMSARTAGSVAVEAVAEVDKMVTETTVLVVKEAAAEGQEAAEATRKMAPTEQVVEAVDRITLSEKAVPAS
jgi:hypothetical protein